VVPILLLGGHDYYVENGSPRDYGS
jgi:hypothetical protein